MLVDVIQSVGEKVLCSQWVSAISRVANGVVTISEGEPQDHAL